MNGQDKGTPSGKTNGAGGERESTSPPYKDSLRSLEIKDVPIGALDHLDRTFQCRLEESLDDLKESLVQEGQRVPVDLFGGRPHRIIDGFRRIGAIQELGWTTVKALIHTRLSEEEAHGLGFHNNVVRKNLSPLDKAHAIFKARQRDRNTGEIARRFQLSNRQIRRYESMLNLPEELLQLVKDHSLGMAQAVVLTGVRPEQVQDWTRRCQENSWSAAALRHELQAKGIGSHHPRGRTYLHKEGDTLRVYSFQISRHSPPDLRDRVRKAIQEITQFLDQA